MFCSLVAMMSLLLSLTANAQSTTDSVFLSNSSKVIFKVNSTDITEDDRRYLIEEVVPMLRTLGPKGVIVGRSAASPEGSYENNRRLAYGRRKTIKEIFDNEGINTERIRFDLAVEEYALLLELMRQKHDPDYELVRNIIESSHNDDLIIKEQLQKAKKGQLFKRLHKQYFAELRAVRIMVYVLPEREIITAASMSPIQMPEPVILDSIKLDLPRIEYPVVEPEPEEVERRELLSLKTNLALYGLNVPKYGWCPIPNVSMEYYPRHGHVAWQADFDCPWWIGNTENHKYFELRNYTLEGRYYLRNSNKSYLEDGETPNGKAAFKGFYLSAYAHAFLYQIGCNKDDGWIGEGLGAGLGLGYVIPLGRRNQHWRLELSAQFGVFRTKYDPFIYGCPVEKIEDGLYYYDYTGDPDLFKKRQYRFTWLGPTRAGITLSYDLLYRRNAKKGASFKRWEKGGEQ